MPSGTTRRRFIAGAVCPRCAALDKIFVDLEKDTRECAACGFSEARPAHTAGDTALSPATTVRELPTRVSRPAARRVETPAEPVRLVDPRSRPDSSVVPDSDE